MRKEARSDKQPVIAGVHCTQHSPPPSPHTQMQHRRPVGKVICTTHRAFPVSVPTAAVQGTALTRREKAAVYMAPWYFLNSSLERPHWLQDPPAPPRCGMNHDNPATLKCRSLPDAWTCRGLSGVRATWKGRAVTDCDEETDSSRAVRIELAATGVVIVKQV
jgi:hypothetical protein